MVSGQLGCNLSLFDRIVGMNAWPAHPMDVGMCFQRRQTGSQSAFAALEMEGAIWLPVYFNGQPVGNDVKFHCVGFWLNDGLHRPGRNRQMP